MKVVIIGAGVAGLSIGWRLLQAGAAVTILDRGQPAQGATWAAAGMLAVTAELEDAPPAERDFALLSNSLWPAFTAELEQASGVRLGFVRAGALMVTRDSSALESMRRRGQVADAAGVRALVPCRQSRPGRSPDHRLCAGGRRPGLAGGGGEHRAAGRGGPVCTDALQPL